MTTSDKIEAIEEKCIEANPSIIELVAIGAPVRANAENIYRQRDIRLADVLLAIYKLDVKNVAVQDNGCFMVEMPIEDENDNIGWAEVPDGIRRYHWNLLKDSLTDQSPETVDFIYQLIRGE